MNKIAKRTWTILRVVILVFLIVGTVDIILIGALVLREMVRLEVKRSDRMETRFQPPPRPSYRYEHLADQPDLAENIINYKRLHLDIDPGRVVASYDVYLKKDHPLFFLAERDWDKDGAQQISNEVLGAVSVEQGLLNFERIETSVTDTDESGHINVTAAPYWPARDKYQIYVHAKQRALGLSIASKEVIVHTRGVKVRTGSLPNPASKTEDETRYILPADADLLYLQVERDPAATAEGAKVQPPHTLAALLQKESRIPGISHLLTGVLEAIPFIIFLVWCKRNASAIPYARSQRLVIETYLIFHFSYIFFSSLSNLIETWRSPFMLALSYFEWRMLPIFVTDHYRNTTNILLLAMALFIYAWVKFARTWADPSKYKTSYRSRKWKQILAALILVGLLGYVGWLYCEKWNTIHTNLGDLTVAEFYRLFFALLVLVLNVLILLLAQASNLPERAGFALNLFFLLMLLIAADIFYMFAVGSGNKYVRFANGILSHIIFIFTAIALVWGFVVLCYRAITNRSLHHDLKHWSATRLALLVLTVLAVALSTRYWTWPMAYWPLWWLAWELKDLFFLVLLWFLASFLHKVSGEEAWLKLPPLARDAGILLALFLFYSPTTRWSYIPVSFIVGFLLLKFWLLPREQFDRSKDSDIKSDRKRLIARVIAFNDAERSLKTLKKELLTKLGKGDVTPEQYGDKLRALGAVVEARRQTVMVRNRFAKEHVLALGAGNSAWDNGYRMASYSLLFSALWSVLYFRDLVRARVPSDTYLALDLLITVVYFFLAWISYGFIFGYFYPQIRGRNGIQKALVMFLTVVVPKLVWTALARPLETENWVSFGVWTLQIFVQMMLLGMIAGDFSIMRSHGFKWSHLLDFYRMSSLSAWISSLILAIAAAASTLITSGATQIMTLALKYVGVIPENVQLPKQ